MNKCHLWVKIKEKNDLGQIEETSKTAQVYANNDEEAKRKAIQQVLSRSPDATVISVEISR